MTILIGIYLLMLSLVIVGVCLTQAMRGTVNVLSLRNFFAMGFLMFQTVSGTWSLFTDDYGGDLFVSDPVTNGVIFAIMCTIFVVIFHVSYSGGWYVKKIATKLNPTFPVPTTSSLLAVSVILVLLAVLFRFVLVHIPVFGVLTSVLSTGLMPAAAAVIVWAWMPQIMNPIVTMISVPLLLFVMFMSVYQNFGRRDLVSVLAACIWAAYHGYWKHRGTAFMLKRLAVLGTAGIVLVAAYTGAREKTTTETTATELISKIGDSDLWYGVFSMASGQAAGGISMYLIETRPTNTPYDTLHSAIYFVTNPIPRILWPGKPEALGFTMVRDAGIRRKAEEFNFGPGLMGHIWNDNPFLAMIPYAIFLGLMIRTLDEVTKRHGINPFLVIPCGVVIGEIIALPRGELGLFLSRTFFSTFAAFAGMIVASRILRSAGWPMATPGMLSDYAQADEFAESYAGGEEQFADQHDPSGHAPEHFTDEQGTDGQTRGGQAAGGHTY